MLTVAEEVLLLILDTEKGDIQSAIPAHSGEIVMAGTVLVDRPENRHGRSPGFIDDLLKTNREDPQFLPETDCPMSFLGRTSLASTPLRAPVPACSTRC